MGVGRVGEIVNTRYPNYPNPALTKNNFKITKNFLMINIHTEKRHTERIVPIARIDLQNEEYFKKNESWLTEDVITYISTFQSKEKIWDKSTRWAEKVFEKYFPEYGQHIHLLRSWRATHLLAGSATGVRVPDQIVAKMGGWKGTNTLISTYDGTTIEQYINEVGD
jgi:integrase